MLAALGGREIVAIGWRHYLGRHKSAAEVEGMHLSNAGALLSDFREAMTQIGQMRREMDRDKNIIAAFKDGKIEDDRKITRRDGIIEEQRKELRALHDEIGEMRARLKDHEARIRDLEVQNSELLKENLQLKGMNESGTSTGPGQE